jgi:5-methyltetrahydrofolate--homocysteine methyltransferase
MHDELFGMVAPYQDGNIDWLRIWAPGTYQSVQCDVCLMLSPGTFSDLFLEALREECRYLDYSLYHLDGSEALRHLEALLSIEELDGIQWNPEPPLAPDPVEFAPFLRRVLDAGKKVYVPCPPERIQPLLDAIGREGVFLSVACKEEARARAVLRELAQIGM